jgi:hypothetical protein
MREPFVTKVIYARKSLEEILCAAERSFNVDIVEHRQQAQGADFIYAGFGWFEK